MTTTFQYIPPQEVVNLPPTAIKYLQRAIDRTPGGVSKLDDMLGLAASGNAIIFLIYSGAALTGASYLIIYDTSEGRIINIVLTGGQKISLWRDDYQKFITDYAKRIGAISIRFIGRDGWGKLYPMCKRIGGIFELNI